MGVFFAVLFGIPVAVGISFWWTYAHAKIGDNPKTHDTAIVSFKDGSMKVTGRFRLGYGTVNSQNMYIYYQETSPGVFVQGTVPAAGTPLIEDASVETARVVQIEDRRVGDGDAWISFGMGEQYQLPRYEVHVPPGTVVQEMSVGG
jgi:hypothetical protein